MSNIITNTIDEKVLTSSIDYNNYRLKIDQLLEKDLSTGPVQNETLLEYSRLNVHRMKRLDKHTIIPETLQSVLASIDRKMIWITITEGWCGDAAQILPVLNKMALLSNTIDLRMILRDEQPEFMNNYLTNGTLAIPIVVGMDAETYEEIFVWGPKPKPAMKILEHLKNDNSVTKNERIQAIQLWYSKDRSVSIFKEFEEILSRFVILG
jgi:hypothetical protein